MRVRCLLAAILVSLSAARVSGRPDAEDETPEPNPGRRPSRLPRRSRPFAICSSRPVSFCPRLSGVANRLSLSHVVKLSVDRRVELLLGGEPVVTATGGGTHEGDLFAGVQLVALSVQDGPTVAVSYLRQLHESPATDFDIGSFRQAGLLLVSGDFLGFHCDANAFLLEETEGSERATQSGGSLSISHSAGRATISASSALHAAASRRRLRRRNAARGLLPRSTQRRSRLRRQPRSHTDLDEMGDPRRLHLSPAAEALVNAPTAGLGTGGIPDGPSGDARVGAVIDRPVRPATPWRSTPASPRCRGRSAP